MTGCSNLALDWTKKFLNSNETSSTQAIASWPVARLLYAAPRPIDQTPGLRYYLFLPDGQCYRECPRGGLDTFNIVAIRLLEDGNCGTYRVSGNQLHLYFPTEEIQLSVASDLSAVDGDGFHYNRVLPAESQILAGHYERLQLEGRYMEFTPDGKVTADSLTWRMVESNYTGPSPVSGYYSIHGNTMLFTREGMEPHKLTYFTDPSSSATESVPLIYLDGIPLQIPS
jgi:hypothetical protein